MMLKILKALIRADIYYSLLSCRLLPEKEKGCYKGTRGTSNLLCIHQHTLKETKNVTMAWIDCKKTYDMFQQGWVADCLKIYNIFDKVIKFIGNTMKIGEWN